MSTQTYTHLQGTFAHSFNEISLTAYNSNDNILNAKSGCVNVRTCTNLFARHELLFSVGVVVVATAENKVKHQPGMEQPTAD